MAANKIQRLLDKYKDRPNILAKINDYVENNVPKMDDMRKFATALAKETGYHIEAESEPSKVLLLKK